MVDADPPALDHRTAPHRRAGGPDLGRPAAALGPPTNADHPPAVGLRSQPRRTGTLRPRPAGGSGWSSAPGSCPARMAGRRWRESHGMSRSSGGGSGKCWKSAPGNNAASPTICRTGFVSNWPVSPSCPISWRSGWRSITPGKPPLRGAFNSGQTRLARHAMGPGRIRPDLTAPKIQRSRDLLKANPLKPQNRVPGHSCSGPDSHRGTPYD